jgi:hypothetical protein
MSEDTNKLSEDEKERVKAWLREKWRNPAICPICGSKEWLVGDHLVQPITMGKDRGLQLGGISYPQVMVISPTCGYTMFLNAVVVGLVPTAAELEKKGT